MMDTSDTEPQQIGEHLNLRFDQRKRRGGTLVKLVDHPSSSPRKANRLRFTSPMHLPTEMEEAWSQQGNEEEIGDKGSEKRKERRHQVSDF